MSKVEVLNSEISEDHSEPSDQDNDSDQEVQEKFIPRIDRNLNYQADFCHVVINLAFTNYPVVKDVARSLSLKIIDDAEETNWDVCWTDHPVTPQTFIRMHFHQTINYIPGIHTIARKNELGKRLNAMQSRIPKEFSFYPSTWMLPNEYPQLRKYMEGPGRHEIFIVKPEAECQGRGIYLVNKIEDILIGRHCVVQKYINNPLLIDNYKFDLRVYVLVGSIDPLRIYIYHDGLARFATESYSSAHKSNFKHSFQHLTNYAVNKLNPKFKAAQSGNDGEGGFKRSLKVVFKALSEGGVDIEKLWGKIEQIAVKTIILGYQKIRNNYVSSQPQEYHNHMAFHILGLDILIDDFYQPFLLEVNHTPSFATETPLDARIKASLIKDTLILMKCCDVNLKQTLFQKAKASNHNRIQNGIRQSYNPETRVRELEQQEKLRLEYEEKKMGGYKVIFPSKDEETAKKYVDLIVKTRDVLTDKRALRKGSFLSQSEFEVEKFKQKEKQKEKSRDREIQATKDRHKQFQRMSLREKKVMDSLKGRRLSINSERQKPQIEDMHQTLTNFIKNELEIINEEMIHSSLLGSAKGKKPRIFTIKTKLSIPEVRRKPSIRAIDPELSEINQIKRDKNRLRIDVLSHGRGAFIKPKTYDVPSLMVTNYTPEEQRVIRYKNKDGRFIFHVIK